MHFPRPLSTFSREALVSEFPRGSQQGSARYGLLLSHFEARVVNGLVYNNAVVFGAPPNAKMASAQDRLSAPHAARPYTAKADRGLGALVRRAFLA